MCVMCHMLGSLLLYWPGAWSISLAAAPGALPDPYLLGAFGVGALLMRGAGCTVNDLWDRCAHACIKTHTHVFKRNFLRSVLPRQARDRDTPYRTVWKRALVFLFFPFRPFFILREIDKQVARTKSRPLARGAVTTQQAVGWLGVQLGVSAGVLFSLEPAAVVLGAASLGLVGICPCRAIRPLDSSLPPVPYSTMRLLLIYQPK
jgi:hypothetical protein